MKPLYAMIVAVGLTVPGLQPATSGVLLKPSWVADLNARAIGPAVMGGRVSDLALDPTDAATFYVGLATGGIMKSTDAGASYQAVFEHEDVASIGAIAVAPSEPRAVWAGTGEANDRNSSGWGKGVYRSVDAGATWAPAGLRESKAIARIAVSPTDPNLAFVAAMGDLWSAGGERGLYRTADGGRTWTRVLSAAGSHAGLVGCGDVQFEAGNPNVLYAALYARRRQPWSFEAGPAATAGEDLGGIFKSVDGGLHWHKLTQGLPRGTGRIGLAVSVQHPQTVMAVVQSDVLGTSAVWNVRSKAGGIFRSDDAGAHWKRSSPLDPRPFYFSQIRIDPADDRRVYVLGFALHVSEDGGHTFREDRFKKIHVDNHALAIDPRRPGHLLIGNDGGVYQSYSSGEHWASLNRFAAGEFYRIAVDEQVPYRVMGGLQDNQSWLGPSRVRRKEGILDGDWTNLGGGDGFYCAFAQDDPQLVYAESQEGSLFRLNLATGETRDLRPAPGEGQAGFRFHWDAPLIASHHAPDVLYLGGNRVFRLAQHGEAWQAISPDLSSRDPDRPGGSGSGAENYGVVYTLAESPRRTGLLWAGTDDGKLWRTEDEGQRWQDLTDRLPAAERGRWVSRVEPGHAEERVAYVAFDGHREGDYAPHILRTDDGGASWSRATGDLPKDGPVRVVREDPWNPNVLVAGTEFGLYVSGDRGGHWVKLGGLPTVAVDDLIFQPQTHDLVIATHGRSLYILDDMRPLEQLTPAVAKGPVHLFEPLGATARLPLGGIGEAGGEGIFYGANPADGAQIDYFVAKGGEGELSIKVLAPSGQPVATLKGMAHEGHHRLHWDLRVGHDLLNDYGSEGAMFVPSGSYTLKLDHGEVHETRTLEVTIPPGMETR